MAKHLILPRVHVMVLCDDIEPSLEEEGVFQLLGVRSALQADSFPYIHPELCVYLQVTGHPGRTSGTVILFQAETDRTLRRRSLPAVDFLGPLNIIPLAGRLRNCEFPAPGLYYIQITFEGKLLGERLLQLVKREEPDDE